MVNALKLTIRIPFDFILLILRNVIESDFFFAMRRLGASNSSINPILYCYMNKKFRISFKVSCSNECVGIRAKHEFSRFFDSIHLLRI